MSRGMSFRETVRGPLTMPLVHKYVVWSNNQPIDDMDEHVLASFSDLWPIIWGIIHWRISDQTTVSMPTKLLATVIPRQVPKTSRVLPHSVWPPFYQCLSSKDTSGWRRQCALTVRHQDIGGIVVVETAANHGLVLVDIRWIHQRRMAHCTGYSQRGQDCIASISYIRIHVESQRRLYIPVSITRIFLTRMQCMGREVCVWATGQNGSETWRQKAIIVTQRVIEQHTHACKWSQNTYGVH